MIVLAGSSGGAARGASISAALANMCRPNKLVASSPFTMAGDGSLAGDEYEHGRRDCDHDRQTDGSKATPVHQHHHDQHWEKHIAGVANRRRESSRIARQPRRTAMPAAA